MSTCAYSDDEIATFVKDIEAAQVEDDTEKLTDIINMLSNVSRFVTCQQLKSSKMSRVVGKLRKHPNSVISRGATSLVNSWKVLLESEDKDVGKSTTSTATHNQTVNFNLNSTLPPLREYLNSTLSLPAHPLQTNYYIHDGHNSTINSKRRQVLNSKENSTTTGPVLYWMSRDQRIADNWALLRAQEIALSKATTLAIIFCLAPSYLDGCIRQRGFMLRGLKQIENDAKSYNIPFILLLGDPTETLPDYCIQNNISTIISDFSPLRIAQEWKNTIASKLGESIYFEMVDSHNICPVWEISNKCEFSAKTIRSKIHIGVNQYLIEFPPLQIHPYTGSSTDNTMIEGEGGGGGGKEGNTIDSIEKWNSALDSMNINDNVPEVDWIHSGERAAHVSFTSFLTRLRSYSDDRNNPILRNGVSNLSPYIRFGQISVQRLILEIRRSLGVTNAALFPANRTTGAHSFCEEVVVRRELSENFCYYNDQYDSIRGAHAWAQTTLGEHWEDKRAVLYSETALEFGETKDELWNAAQSELVVRGKMHGFMRMYWAKKILEWTSNPDEALRIAIYLNDKYSLDGRCPNGYVGCMWAIAGVHDRAWGPERQVFGKIRYMNYEGCKRKFDIKAYVSLNPMSKLQAIKSLSLSRTTTSSTFRK